jgi:hypothetical protein
MVGAGAAIVERVEMVTGPRDGDPSFAFVQVEGTTKPSGIASS